MLRIYRSAVQDLPAFGGSLGDYVQSLRLKRDEEGFGKSESLNLG
jgi:hypothetical protein